MYKGGRAGGREYKFQGLDQTVVAIFDVLFEEEEEE
jgi:hypothetical protein